MSFETVARVLEAQGNLNAKLVAELTARRPESLDGRRVPVTRIKNGAEFLRRIRNAYLYARDDAELRISNAATYGSESAGADGGYAVPVDFRSEVVEPVIGSASIAGQFDPLVTPSNQVVMAVDPTPEWSSTSTSAAVTAEGTSTTVSKPALNQLRLTLQKISALVHASEEIDDDSEGFGRYIWQSLGRKIKGQVEKALLLGGPGCVGLLRAPSLVVQAKESGQASATIAKENVARMAGRIPPGGWSRAFWIAHTSTLPQLAGLSVNIFNATPAGTTLLGRPVFFSEWASTLGSQGDLILVDPAGHLLAVQAPKQLATIDFGFDQGLKSFRASLRVAFAPLLAAPVARLSGSDTMSHVVTLAAR